MTGTRIGDAERDDAARELGEQFTLGRLNREEYDERLARALAARTQDSLNALFGDLPRIKHPQNRMVKPPERVTLLDHVGTVMGSAVLLAFAFVLVVGCLALGVGILRWVF